MTEPSLLFTVISFVLVIGLLVFVHELGHYLAGRYYNVKAETFSIGFGQALLKWQDKRGTVWKLGWIPLGGYVRFAGDMSPAGGSSPEWLSLPPEERNQTFQSKGLWARTVIVAAGPFTNFLLAVVIFTGFMMVYGERYSPAVASSIVQGSAAEMAGLRTGDKITKINGDKIDSFQEISHIVALNPGAKMSFEIDRKGQIISLPVTISADKQSDKFGNVSTIGKLGIASDSIEHRPIAWYQAPLKAVVMTGEITKAMIKSLGQIIVGDRSVEELGGPLKIAQISGQQASIGYESLLIFIAMISINLGFINLLPIPILDGGHLLFYLVEAVRGRPVSHKTQSLAFRAGFALLLGLMAFTTVIDLFTL